MSLQYLSDREVRSHQAHTSPVVSVCWLSSVSGGGGGVVLSGDCEGNLRAWDAVTARAFASLPRVHSTAVHCISTNRDASLVLTLAIDGSLGLWDFALFQHTTVSHHTDEGEAGGHDEPLLPLPVDDASRLVKSRLESLLSLPSGSVKVSEAWKTLLHPTLPIFACVGAGATITLHSTGQGDNAAPFGTLLLAAEPPSSANKNLFGLSLASNADGTLLAVGCNSGKVLLYSCRLQEQDTSSPEYTLDLIAEYGDHPTPVRALALSPGHLYVGGDDRILTIHDVRSLQNGGQLHARGYVGGTVASLSGHKGWILATAPVPSSSRVVASISMDKTIRFWDLDVNPKTCICTCSETDTIRAFAFQPSPSNPPGETGADAGSTSVAGFGQSSRFVTASNDGKLRWYRSAGI